MKNKVQTKDLNNNDLNMVGSLQDLSKQQCILLIERGTLGIFLTEEFLYALVMCDVFIYFILYSVSLSGFL